MDFVVGIDPGLRGAVAVLDAANGVVVAVYDAPSIVTGRGERRDYNVPRMVEILESHPRSHVWVEKQGAILQSSHASWKVGYGAGLWLGVLAALRLPHTVVAPQAWQRAMYEGAVGTGKDRSLLVASRLWPGMVGIRHDHADALLIAEYGRRKLR